MKVILSIQEYVLVDESYGSKKRLFSEERGLGRQIIRLLERRGLVICQTSLMPLEVEVGLPASISTYEFWPNYDLEKYY